METPPPPGEQGPVPPPPPLPGASPIGRPPAEPPRRVARDAGRLVTILVIVVALVSAVSIAAIATELPHISRVHSAIVRGDQSSVVGEITALISEDRRAHAANVAFLIVFVIAGVAWIRWQYLSHQTLRTFYAAGALKFSPRDAALWWILPIANLVVPLRVNRELRERAAEAAGEKDPETSRINLWWGIYLGAGALAIVASVYSTQAQDAAKSSALSARPWSLLLSNGYFLIASRFGVIVSAFLATGVVKRSDELLDRAYQRATGRP